MIVYATGKQLVFLPKFTVRSLPAALHFIDEIVDWRKLHRLHGVAAMIRWRNNPGKSRAREKSPKRIFGFDPLEWSAWIALLGCHSRPEREADSADEISLSQGLDRRRTPGPPPFEGINSTPASSNAIRSADTFAVVKPTAPSTASARRMVATPRRDFCARSSALHRRRALAARICAPVIIFHSYD